MKKLLEHLEQALTQGDAVLVTVTASSGSTPRGAGARMLVLETQSCNMPAIGFYLSQGFAIGGLDLFHYSNEDLERHEVRIEMMRMLESINAP